MKEHDNVDINGVILEPKHNQELIRDCSKSCYIYFVSLSKGRCCLVVKK